MSGARSFSPLRYPGGKNKLSLYVENLIDANNLNNSVYIEPFAGGSAVALYLLMNGVVDNIIINDFDRSIYAFWYSVINYTDELCELIKSTKINIDEWRIQRDVQQNKENRALLELGFSTLFLNRTNISGIIKAGVIGGIKQEGNYKLDCRFDKTKLIKKIRLIAEYKNNIELYNMDTIVLIDNVINNLDREGLTFFDPPYYEKGSSLYVNFYKHEDHLELSNKIKQIQNHYWIVTYDHVKEIEDMYDGYRKNIYRLKYTAAKKYTGEEIMFYSDNLNIPDVCQNVI